MFYDFIQNIQQSQQTCMSYDTMIKNVEFVLKYFNVVVPKNVRYCMT